jgi:subtilisin family serine protease
LGWRGASSEPDLLSLTREPAPAGSGATAAVEDDMDQVRCYPQAFGPAWMLPVRVPRRAVALVVALAAILALAPGRATAHPVGGGGLVSVIVRQTPGSGDGPAELVRSLGGALGRRLDIIGGFTALLPAAALPAVERDPRVVSVSRNQPVHLSAGSYDSSGDGGSMYKVAQETGATAMWAAGWTGRGVDVALIDSGVAPVTGLNSSGKVIHGPDLSFDSQAPNLAYLDTFGHGTHMAGIIAGDDDPTVTPSATAAQSNFMGMAPDSRLVSVKVADASGATDISQIIAAIGWVVQHRYDGGMNIRVLNLSFGTDGTQDYRVDPLAYAAEVAWRTGIVVVVAGGNAGFGSSKLNNPAYDPFLLAVGADDSKGTTATSDDQVPSFSSSGDGTRGPDLIAPGKSIVSLNDAGSSVDLAYPSARVGTRSLRGSGTSQAAAVVSGAAALLAQQRWGASPDQIKALLTSTGTSIPGASAAMQGHGLVNLSAARTATLPTAVQTFQASTGTGSLEAARGSAHLVDNGVTLQGERDIFGASFNSSQTATASAQLYAWQAGWWSGSHWAGDYMSGDHWLTTTWSGATWGGTAWSSIAWSSNRWSSNRWSGTGWSSSRWSSSRWSGDGWSSAGWS